MAFKAASLLLSLVLSCVWLLSMPGVEGEVFRPCKTSKECQVIHCSIGDTARCISSWCRCPDFGSAGVSDAVSGPSEHVSCKTSSDCKSVFECVSGDPVCMDSECRCLDG